MIDSVYLEYSRLLSLIGRLTTGLVTGDQGQTISARSAMMKNKLDRIAMTINTIMSASKFMLLTPGASFRPSRADESPLASGAPRT